jgi:cytochrome c-type biogenesis protein
MGNTRNPGLIGAYVIGLAFAFGWTPCVGPVLATILFTAAGTETATRGAALLFVYGLGMTLPFVLAALFIGPFMRRCRSTSMARPRSWTSTARR